jgi:hypothetical protein
MLAYLTGEVRRDNKSHLTTATFDLRFERKENYLIVTLT